MLRLFWSVCLVSTNPPVTVFTDLEPYEVSRLGSTPRRISVKTMFSTNRTVFYLSEAMSVLALLLKAQSVWSEKKCIGGWFGSIYGMVAGASVGFYHGAKRYRLWSEKREEFRKIQKILIFICQYQQNNLAPAVLAFCLAETKKQCGIAGGGAALACKKMLQWLQMNDTEVANLVIQYDLLDAHERLAGPQTRMGI